MRNKKPKTSSFLIESPTLDREDILGQLTDNRGTSLLLGRYSLNEVAAVLMKRNFLKEAQRRKLWPLDFELDSSEYPIQKLEIFYKEKKPENIVVDLKIREGRYKVKNPFALQYLSSEYDFLFLEWLTLQNPLQKFGPDRGPLPGQSNPGLKLGRKVFDLFVYLGRVMRKDGLLAFPAYFHNALLFSRYFHFINPEKEGEIQALRKTFTGVPFKHLAWIVHLNCLRWGDNKVYEWQAEPEIYPFIKPLREYFESKAYKKKARDVKESLHFTIDWKDYEKKTTDSGFHLG